MIDGGQLITDDGWRITDCRSRMNVKNCGESFSRQHQKKRLKSILKYDQIGHDKRILYSVVILVRRFQVVWGAPSA